VAETPESTHMTLRIGLASGLAALLLAGQAAAQMGNEPAKPDPAFACHVGLYRLADGTLVDVAPVDGAGGRWRLLDGRTGRVRQDASGAWTGTEGWTDRPARLQASFDDCPPEGAPADRMTFDGREARRVALPSTDVAFVGAEGARLTGRLILPPGEGPVPIMVEIHGSEASAALDFNWFQRLAPAAGVGVFVYDKRGTGGSEGSYTQNFELLATDAAAATRAAREAAGPRAGRVGLHGGSQGGWVAPLAATKTPVDFVVVGYGMAEGVLAEDFGEMRLSLEAKGWGPEVIAEARKIQAVTSAFVASNGAVGFADVEAVRARYASEPWWNDIGGDFSSVLLRSTNEEITAILSQMQWGIMWDYDPLPTLRSVDAPILWILAADDTEAPIQGTRERLTMLAGQGRPITLLQYPDADHGIIQFERGPDGSRAETRYSEGYIQAVLDWAAHGALRHDLGRGEVLARPR
jgi:dienelactone hydrolase